MNSTPTPKAIEPHNALIARADEQLAHAHEQMVRADEELARLSEQVAKMERDAARPPSFRLHHCRRKRRHLPRSPLHPSCKWRRRRPHHRKQRHRKQR
jgi:hypothetical protein